MTTVIRSFAATDTGRVRKHNEDAYADCTNLGLWAVADGAGGHAAGEVASAMLVARSATTEVRNFGRSRLRPSLLRIGELIRYVPFLSTC